MTLNQLRYFRVLAKAEHYTNAADALSISQPSLSRAIALLEEELGVLLFARRGRNVVLTDAGRTLLRYVESGLDTLDAGVTAMRDFRSGSERVSLGSITPVVNTYLPKMLADFRTDINSNACFDIRVDQTSRLLAGLKSGLYDMVFCSYTPGEYGLLFTPVVELPFVVAMRRDDPLATCTEITPEQLAGKPMVFTDSEAYSDLLRRMLGEYGIEPEIRGYSNEDSVLLSMVQAGLGVFISTDHPQMYSPDTVLIPLRQDRYRRYVYMVTRPGLAASTSAAQLIQYNLRRAVPEQGRQPRADGGSEESMP